MTAPGCTLLRSPASPLCKLSLSLQRLQGRTNIARTRAAAARRITTVTAGRGFGAVAEREAEAISADSLEWTTPLKIIAYPDPRLRSQNARITTFSDTLRKFAADMFEAMYNGDDGVGLAAPQVGVNVRLMVFNETGKRGAKEETVLINPKIVSQNRQISVYEEGCLSFPRIFADVERPTQVKVKAQALDGSKFSMTLTGFNARIFQHEYDHLQGVLFHDRMKPKVLDTIKPSLAKLENEFRTHHPDVAIQAVAT